MIIVIFSRPVFLFQSKLNNTDGVATIRRTPITIISIGKIIIRFIIKLFYQFLPSPCQITSYFYIMFDQ